MGKLTTPPPPNRELLAAFTIEVVARVVIEVRINETLELHNEDGVGRETSVGLEVAGWSRPSLYRSDIVGIEDSWTGADMFCWWHSLFVLTRRHSAGDVLGSISTLCISEANRPVPPCIKYLI